MYDPPPPIPTTPQTGKVDLFLKDLQACVTEVGVAAAAAKVAQMNGGIPSIYYQPITLFIYHQHSTFLLFYLFHTPLPHP